MAEGSNGVVSVVTACIYRDRIAEEVIPVSRAAVAKKVGSSPSSPHFAINPRKVIYNTEVGLTEKPENFLGLTKRRRNNPDRGGRDCPDSPAPTAPLPDDDGAIEPYTIASPVVSTTYF